MAALTESVVSAAEVGGVGDDFAVSSEECGPLQLGKCLHTWSGQQLSKSKSIYNNFLLTTFHCEYVNATLSAFSECTLGNLKIMTESHSQNKVTKSMYEYVHKKD